LCYLNIAQLKLFERQLSKTEVEHPFAVSYEAATLPSGRAKLLLLGLKGGSMKRRPGMTLPARNFQPSCERATGTYRC